VVEHNLQIASQIVLDVSTHIVHEYLEVDQGIVFSVATDHLEDYELFAQSVTAWLGRL
jgi:uncharacterized protein YutE (UPF0331/DUF86 family)